MASIRASCTSGFSPSPCYRIKASNVDAFRNKQNTPRNFNQANVVIAFEKNSNSSQKPYMGITNEKALTKTKKPSFLLSHMWEKERGVWTLLCDEKCLQIFSFAHKIKGILRTLPCIWTCRFLHVARSFERWEARLPSSSSFTLSQLCLQLFPQPYPQLWFLQWPPPCPHPHG